MATFTTNFNVTGARRKELVNLISDFTGCEAKYKGAPTFAYEIDYFTIGRNGELSFDDRADSEVIERLFETLHDNGFTAETVEGENAENSEVSETAEELPDTLAESEHSETVGLTVKIPKDKVELENLNKLLLGKETLIKKALGINELPVQVEEDCVAFPWFENVNADEARAYSHFIAALCAMSVNAKRVTVTDKEVDNEKYAFRCFLLRLGFIGGEYKRERKILLRNFEGSSAYKSAPEKEVEPI